MTMMDLVDKLPQQLTEALAIGEAATLPKTNRTISNIVVSGLGGSGIGANMVYDLLGSQITVPFTVNKDYGIPAFVNENTLFIACSYSGNTEETLSALQLAMEKGALITSITSGGKLATLAEEHSFGCIKIPGGMPPRACLGYSLVQQMFTLNHFGIVNNSFVDEIEDAIELLSEKKEEIKSYSKQIASELKDKTPVLYVPDGYEALAVRWRQQINENSKMLCWHHVLPEMTHNEILGWRFESDNIAPIFFDTDTVNPRTRKRIELTKQVVEKYVPNIYEMDVNGGSKIVKTLYWNYIGDWLSVYLAEERGVVAIEIDVINYLKGELAKL